MPPVLKSTESHLKIVVYFSTEIWCTFKIIYTQLDISPIYETVPVNKDALIQLKNRVSSNEIFQTILISNQGKNTSISIELGLPEGKIKERYQVYEQVKDILENKIKGTETHYIAGLPAVTAALGKVMIEDAKKLFAIVILIVVTCLILTFRKIKGFVVPLSVVLLSLAVTLGLKAFMGIPLNIITISLPVFVLSIGV